MIFYVVVNVQDWVTTTIVKIKHILNCDLKVAYIVGINHKVTREWICLQGNYFITKQNVCLWEKTVVF